MEALKDYVAHLDNKKRITLRGASYEYYNVKEYGNGCIILEPRELALPKDIFSKNTVRYGSSSERTLKEEMFLHQLIYQIFKRNKK